MEESQLLHIRSNPLTLYHESITEKPGFLSGFFSSPEVKNPASFHEYN
ncbi:Uncharacterized protein dnm_024280 [Desulfonema magnum]|uniref:Uncharacterized protein n=1 Tax=Desulfonema magnum TaxID=45655 RepID=A0A975BIN4_9BACT|nr:Uncharacterized protein dnm_024280 [Desulfonema magnum]